MYLSCTVRDTPLSHLKDIIIPVIWCMINSYSKCYVKTNLDMSDRDSIIFFSIFTVETQRLLEIHNKFNQEIKLEQ